MLTNLSIKNFRGIKDLNLDNASRVNLVVGRNDTGKTSMIESIRLLVTGDPRHLRRTSRNRFERRPIGIEQTFRQAFYQAIGDEPILIHGSVGRISLTAEAMIREIQGEETLPLDLDSDVEGDEAIKSMLQPGKEVVVIVRADNGSIATIRQHLRSGEMLRGSQRKFQGDTFPDIPPFVWLGTNRAEAWAHAGRYSLLFRMGASESLLALLKEIEPRLKDLIVLSSRSEGMSSHAVLEVDLGLPELLPLESMGDGFVSTIAILSAIAAAKDGLCLIDEIENGIHYSLHEQIWRSVLEGSHKFNSQVWATTHSYDCIAAIHAAFSEDPDALRVHRLDRKANGTVCVHSFDHDMLGLALEQGLDVR